ncbi:type II toxin-antitoxin system RelE/ParE family toxin [Prosthecochloris sp. SCSIO W1102]|uniref:type II toxin-antitoxin system RelE/ParE family toxin n=1 Tax=Prosthecochloris sp. SCSIO W1102 TaxID=2992243 RepID=UPI00223DA591|nr:type II toxin-antitoxin system RelE/ParE family toxin [Prosthecochloris sp. SCSIO W1102]UZJ39191.1 type II toxin-antitoxin system RelE/ParE family toxin [Prosthecochloris sp. SCSIO W1102]
MTKQLQTENCRLISRLQDSGSLIFLYAFAKNERVNISDKGKTALRLVAESFVSSTESGLKTTLARPYLPQCYRKNNCPTVGTGRKKAKWRCPAVA